MVDVLDNGNAKGMEDNADAFYAKELDFDLSAVTPFVAGPNEVKTIVALPEIEQEKVKIHKAFLLSCVNGRLEDFAEAAKILENQKIADGVNMYIAAASSEIEDEATKVMVSVIPSDPNGTNNVVTTSVPAPLAKSTVSGDTCTVQP